MKTAEQKAIELAQLMEDGKGKDVVVLDVTELSAWTNYFVIVTITSGAHWQGLYRQAKDYAKENALEMHTITRKLDQGDDWNLLDFGSIVVHLMSTDARNFYEFEKLWHAGKRVDFKNTQ